MLQRLVEVVSQEGVHAHQIPVSQGLTVQGEGVQQREEGVLVPLQVQRRTQCQEERVLPHAAVEEPSQLRLAQRDCIACQKAAAGTQRHVGGGHTVEQLPLGEEVGVALAQRELKGFLQQLGDFGWDGRLRIGGRKLLGNGTSCVGVRL